MSTISILCPTTLDRSEMFDKLYDKLLDQVTDVVTTHPRLGSIQVLVDDSKRFLDGGLSIGKKRESLLKRSNGKYVCYLDSDEDIAPNYVENLMRLAQSNADVLTFRNLTTTDFYWTIVDMSLNYQVNDQASPNFITRRRPWHVCPVKKEFAQLYPFEDINYGEDFDWMSKVLNHCTTEAHTDAVIHMYRHSKKHSEADRITNYGKDRVQA
jgi:glycosyltransferase involved in cell wall biosynthesis